MNIGRIFKSAFRSVKDHSGTICAVTAMAGVVATAILSGKATVRADHEIDCDMTRKERAKVYIRCYWKTAAVGAATCGLIFGSDRIHVRKEVGLAGLAALWKSKYVDLDNKLGEVAGADIRDDVHRAIAKDETCIPEDANTYGDKKIIFYEPFTKQYIESTYAQYLEAMLETNFRFNRDFSVSLSVPIDYMGGKLDATSDSMIWSVDDELQQYNWYGYEGTTVQLCDKSKDDLERWIRSNEKQYKENAVKLIFNVDPTDVRLLEWDEKTGTYQFKEELPWG